MTLFPARAFGTVIALAAALIAPGAPVVAAPATAASRPAAVLRVMPLGDSITWGVGSRTTSGYRADLQHRLAAAGLAVDFVGSRSNGLPGSDTNHEGHPGWTIAQLAERTDGWLAAYRPDVVLLLIGMNDLKVPATTPGAAARLAALINRIRRDRPAAHIFVAKISGSAIPAVQARVEAYNAAIPYIVAARGPLVHLVDQSAVRGPYLHDSVHPNDSGYAKMSYLWYRAITLSGR